MRKKSLLKYLQKGVRRLVQSGSFEGGQSFRGTQREALEAYDFFLQDTAKSIKDRLQGFFEIPTGVGKTAIFSGIIGSTHNAANQDGETLKTIIVVPTITLLEQTEEALSRFTPGLDGQIGFFGGGNKDLSRPITVMTYSSWVTLVEEKKVSSENIDILISDEAHRGTSEARSEHIFSAFGKDTARIAFTATAHFDQDKSVQSTHINQIFYKRLVDAVITNELAAYIQPQRYVIRVEPSEEINNLREKFPDNSKQVTMAIKQAAWNKRALAIFLDGYDHRTGDPLSDNQAGFFVGSISQANQLQKMLNSNTRLKQKAIAMGYEKVAISIHSGLTAKEQKRRMKQYKEGLILAVVGDDKFKEGFDHPPMKTIIDYPHSSLVDKAQILGRGSRQWWNNKKQRYEGLTFIDTIVYIGSHDVKMDKMLRLRAFAGAITARDVLEESYALSSSYVPAPNVYPRTSGSSASIVIDGQSIEEFAELDDVCTFDAIIQEIKDSIAKVNYTIDDVLVAAKNYLNENNSRPSKLSGEAIIGGYNTDWYKVDGVISSGKFPDYTSLSDMLNKHQIANYSVRDIIFAARVYCRRHGKKPSAGSGDVIFKASGVKTTYTAIDLRARRGGFEGYSSLRDMLAAYQVGEFSIDDIEATARKFLKEKGKRPSRLSGYARFGKDKIKLSWGFIDSRFLKKQYPGYTSLSDFLNKRNIDFKYTADDVANVCKEFLRRNNKRPNALSGKVEIGPDFVTTNFSAIDQRFLAGHFPGFKSLKDLMDQKQIGTSKRDAIDYTEQDIVIASKAYLAAHGERPSLTNSKSTMLKIQGRTVAVTNIHAALARGAVQGCKYKKLSDLFDANNIGQSIKPKVEYTLNDIVEAARIHLRQTGVRPNMKTDNWVINGQIVKAKNVNAAIKRGKFSDCPYKSLAQLLDANEVPRELHIEGQPAI